MGVAARAPRDDRPQRATACSRCFRSSRRSTRRRGIPVTYVGHPMAQDAATPHHAARDARAPEARRRRHPCSRCCPAAGCPRSRCTRASCSRPPRALIEARSRRAVPRAVRRRARRAMRSRTRCIAWATSAADHAAVRSRRGRAARRRRRHRRVGHRHARGGARALPARHLLSRVKIDRLPRQAQAPAALCRIAQRARRSIRRARVPAERSRRRATSRRRR